LRKCVACDKPTDWKGFLENPLRHSTAQFPHEQGTTLKIKSSRPVARTIHVRIPGWTTADAQVKINGRTLEAMADPGSYLAIRRVWKDGDTVSLSLPMELRHEVLAGDDSVSAALYGPLVLAADLGPGPEDGPLRVIHSGDTIPKGIPAPGALPNAAAKAGDDPKQWIQVASQADLRFTAASDSAKLNLVPMYQIGSQRYSVYWQMQAEKKQQG
jgi:DUF1680 family protein